MMEAPTKAAAPEPDDPPGTPRTMAQFFVPITASLQERRPRTLKYGDTFAVFDHNGDALAGPGSPEGIYHRDTRHLSHLYLTVERSRPLLLSSTIRDDNAMLICDLTNAELADAEGRRIVAQDLIHIRRNRFLWNARAFERMALSNYDIQPRRIELQIDFAADFADIFEVRGAERAEARRGASGGGRAGRGDPVLHRARRAAPGDPAAFRAGADADHRRQRRLRGRSGALRAQDLLPRDPLRAGLRHPGAAGGVLRLLPRGPPGAAPDRLAGGVGLLVERGLQRDGAPLGQRSLHAGHRHAERAVSLCRHPVVQHRFRPRCADHRAADAVARPDDRPRRAPAPRGSAGDRARRRRGCRAGQDPARDALRRDGGAARGAVRLLLRQRRIRRRCS